MLDTVQGIICIMILTFLGMYLCINLIAYIINKNK